MDSKHLKNKALYYWIRKFNEQSKRSQDSRHIDDFSNFSGKRLSRRYWLTYALELYTIANSYVFKKTYNVSIFLCVYINIGDDSIDNMQEWSNAYFKNEWTPPELYLLKTPIWDSFVKKTTYSENLSTLLHRDIYYSELNQETYGYGYYCFYIGVNTN